MASCVQLYAKQQTFYAGFTNQTPFLRTTVAPLMPAQLRFTPGFMGLVGSLCRGGLLNAASITRPGTTLP